MTAQIVPGTYRFDPRYRKQILDLAYHREPNFPSFIGLQLRSTSQRSETVKATMWYAGKTIAPDGRETARYHVQTDESGKVMPAIMDDTQSILEVMETEGNIHYERS
jgi:hypothetical protein